MPIKTFFIKIRISKIGKEGFRGSTSPLLSLDLFDRDLEKLID